MRLCWVWVDALVEAAHVPKREEFLDPLPLVVMVDEHCRVVGEVAVAVAVGPGERAVLILLADIAPCAHFFVPLRMSRWSRQPRWTGRGWLLASIRMT